MRKLTWVPPGVGVLQRAVDLPEVEFSAGDVDTVTSSYGVVTTGKYSLTSAAGDAFKIAPGPKGFVSNLAYELSKHRCFERELEGLTAQVAY